MSGPDTETASSPGPGRHVEATVAVRDFRPMPLPAGPRATFPAEDIHLWRANLDVPADVREALGRTLSADEVARARRTQLPRDRRRLEVSRGILRRLLSSYTGIPAANLQIRYGSHGKPALSGPAADHGVHFSLSHSGDLLLIGMARSGPVGVDVERIQPRRHAERIVRRYWTPREQDAFHAAPRDRKPQAFLDGWTRKEACAKAVGVGIWTGVERFEVALGPGEPPRLLSVDGDPDAASGWRLLHLLPMPGYVGALALRGVLGPVSARELIPEDLP